MSNWKSEYIINGNRFSNSNSFYNHIEKIFTKGLDWKNIEKSKEVLNSDFFEAIIEIIKENENIEFITSK